MRLQDKKKSEATEQALLMDWANLMSNTYKELSLLFHIPNGGSRNRLEAINLKRQGVKAGVPDLFLPVSRHGKNGLFIEMKFGKNRTTNLQEQWLKNLNKQGYAAVVCYGFEDAVGVIKGYLGIVDFKVEGDF